MESLGISGVKIATINCGIKYKNRDDLLLVVFDKIAAVSGVFTSSSIVAAPVAWCKKNIRSGKTKALVVNSGNANAFTGKEGEKSVSNIVKKTATELKCKENEILVCSTGVIGEPLKDKLITDSIPDLISKLASNERSFKQAAAAILTTDTKPKIATKESKIAAQSVKITGFVKGSGMIAPNMATLLGYIFTDANISASVLNSLLREVVASTFNSISVDSDQSTNDTILMFATKAASHELITKSSDPRLKTFRSDLFELCLALAKMIVTDGEGAKKLIEIEVKGAASKRDAKKIAFGIANSPLVKTAVAGADPNWGRIVMAVGKSCPYAVAEKLKVKIGGQLATKSGMKHPDFDEDALHKYLQGTEIKIEIDLALTSQWLKNSAKVYTCDLNEEYIEINKSYKT